MVLSTQLLLVGAGTGAEVSVVQPQVAKQLSYAVVPSSPVLPQRELGLLLTHSQSFHVLPLYHVVLSTQLLGAVGIGIGVDVEKDGDGIGPADGFEVVGREVGASVVQPHVAKQLWDASVPSSPT